MCLHEPWPQPRWVKPLRLLEQREVSSTPASVGVRRPFGFTQERWTWPSNPAANAIPADHQCFAVGAAGLIPECAFHPLQVGASPHKAMVGNMRGGRQGARWPPTALNRSGRRAVNDLSILRLGCTDSRRYADRGRLLRRTRASTTGQDALAHSPAPRSKSHETPERLIQLQDEEDRPRDREGAYLDAALRQTLPGVGPYTARTLLASWGASPASRTPALSSRMWASTGDKPEWRAGRGAAHLPGRIPPRSATPSTSPPSYPLHRSNRTATALPTEDCTGQDRQASAERRRGQIASIRPTRS
jgi:hypothetical protein